MLSQSCATLWYLTDFNVSQDTLGLVPGAVSSVVQVVLPSTGSLRSIAMPWSTFKVNSIAVPWFAFWSAAVKSTYRGGRPRNLNLDGHEEVTGAGESQGPSQNNASRRAASQLAAIETMQSRSNHRQGGPSGRQQVSTCADDPTFKPGRYQ